MLRDVARLQRQGSGAREPGAVQARRSGPSAGIGFRERPGLGDMIVVIALLVLVATLALPLRRGQQIGAHEAATRVRLAELGRAAQRSGLNDALRAMQRATRELADVEAVTRYYLGRTSLRFLPTWEDNSYFYRLRLDAGAAAGGVLVDAEPRKPGSSGRVSYHSRGAGDIEEAPVLGDRHLVDERVENNEARARARCAKLASLADSAGIRAALRKFRETWLAAQAAEAASDEGYPTLRDENYAMQAWPIFEAGDDGVRLKLEILAWPRRAGESGFASFRIAGSSAVLQSRNLVRPYDGRSKRNIARPGAGIARKASERNNSAYLGVDGNHWFHAKTHAAR